MKFIASEKLFPFTYEKPFLRNLPETLCKIQETLYLPEEKRNAQKILQLIIA